MSVEKVDLKLVRWFEQLPEEQRYKFSSQWLNDEASKLSIAKLASYLPGDKKYSESVIKALRSYDLSKNKLKDVWRPKQGISADDIYAMCTAINKHRETNGRTDFVDASDFYQRAWQELSDKFPLDVQDDKKAPIDSGPEQTDITPIDAVQTEENIVTELDVEVGEQNKVSTRIYLVVYVALFVLLAVILLTYFAPDHKTLSANQTRYLPGNIVQINQRSAQLTAIPLAKPTHFLSADSCYGDLEANDFALNWESDEQLKLFKTSNLEVLHLVLPQIPQTDAAITTKVKLDGAKMLEIEKGQFNLGIADVCLQSLQNSVDLGAQIEDYAIIKKTIVVDSITYVLKNSDGNSADNIARLTDEIAQLFEQPVVKSKLMTDSSGIVMEQLIVKGPIVIAYVSQSMIAQTESPAVSGRGKAVK